MFAVLWFSKSSAMVLGWKGGNGTLWCLGGSEQQLWGGREVGGQSPAGFKELKGRKRLSSKGGRLHVCNFVVQRKLEIKDA